ncbi:biotin--protein ligase isoform X2 [Episyrphus balteatus]|uniref:biotin--protein ligase isoform X2 n=1 Tax=Episyrphus balteatus TaxID=286459 RepID=UPI0024866F88|nr:biotin--protein ligase isoform X2 [Episyrphus balteatus]
MLSLYYITATFVQSWRIQKACTKIAEKFSEKSSVVFYVLPKDGYEANLVTSELCTNRSEAKVCDLLWMFADHRGCCLTPSQNIHIGPWVTFPEPPTLIPFNCSSSSSDEELNLDKGKIVHLLLETDIIPSLQETSLENVMIEKYGKPIAWKVDSHFAVLLESDIDHFTNLLIATFLQNNLCINDSLPLIRIESVGYEGQPQPYEVMKKHFRKQLTSRCEFQLGEEEWLKHLDGLRSLSVLANQATEFEYNKNRTEGKTGIVKPDLIPSGKNLSDLSSQTNEEVDSRKSSPIKVLSEKPKIEAKVSPMKRVPEEPAIKSVKEDSVIKSSPKSPTKPVEVKKPNPTEEVIETKPSHLESIVTAKIEPIPRTISEPPPVVSGVPVDKAVIKDEKKAETLASKTSDAISAVKNNTKRPSLRRSKESLKECKPLNILVYSDVATSRDNVVSTLKNILERDMYTVYPLTSQQVKEKSWFDNTSLLVICGSVTSDLGEILVDFFLQGGKLLSLCSDVLHIVLPTYRTAEVREHELVQFSYDKWQKVKMMHYIFCYHPSPVKKNFSTDSEESSSTLSKKPSIEMKDLQGDMHNLDVKVLGSEETWNTPSLLLATNLKSGGKAVFSQVHLETNPSEYESDESKYKVLKENEKNRLEIFADLLVKHLGFTTKKDAVLQEPKITYQNAFFLGRHELKFEVLEKLKSLYNADNMIQTSKLSMKFCGKNETVPSAKTNVLPILIHNCPDDFSTIDYFDNLSTKDIGRLVIYAPIISSSMHIISELNLTHGIAVLPRQQTDGLGRSNNQWLSPLGCAMFSLQLHIPLNSPLGERLPFIQHIIGISVVNAIKQLEKYEFLDIAIKWPNDIYINGTNKIGGLIVTSTLTGNLGLVNIGVGLNLDNKVPGVCINDLIQEHNRISHQKIPLLGYERLMALIFNEIERLIDMAQNGRMDEIYPLYYSLWLHEEQEIEIQDQSGRKEQATIIGIDEFGFLKIKTKKNNKVTSVQPDGNSFDMLKGLILPKWN